MKFFFFLGPVVPKVFVMNVSNDTPTFLLNNQTALAAKYAKMAKPQIKIVQVSLEKLFIFYRSTVFFSTDFNFFFFFSFQQVELDSGYIAQVKLLLPPLLRDRQEMVFPCVLYVLVDELFGKIHH